MVLSHTIRRRKTRNAWERGRKRLHPGKSRPRPVARQRPQLTAQQRSTIITDHAIVRWLECVVGIDVRSKIETDMLAGGRDQLIAEMGQGRLHLSGYGVCLLVKEGKVVTVEEEGVPE